MNARVTVISVLASVLSCFSLLAAASANTTYPLTRLNIPAIGTSCTNLVPSTDNKTLLIAIVFESNLAQSPGSDLALYDTGSNTGCSKANEIYHTGAVGAGAFILLNYPLLSGVSYTFTGTWQGDGFRLITN